MFALHGTGLGGGIVVGRAVVLESRLIDVPRYRVEFGLRAAETARLARAVETVRSELSTIAEHLPPDAPSEAQALLQVHAMILDDPSLAPQATVAIESHGQNAEWAFASQAEHLAAQFEQFEDAYLRERGRDVNQVSDRVLKALAGSGRAQRARVGEVPLIFVAHDVSPADMLQLQHAGGFAIDLGGTASHTAILARSMNVPAVVGLDHAARMIRDDDWLVLDGDAGVLVVAPDESVLDEYRHRMALGLLERKQLSRLVHVPSATLDGVPIELHANIELPTEAEQALEMGAAGIGLFRTEFLFLNRAELPGEDEQYLAYRDAVMAMRGRPVTIRTIDVGADKALGRPDDDDHEPAATPNPALGQRAIRYSLAEPDIFLEQIRAILRAAEHGPVRLLIPMLVHGHEVDQTMRLVEQAREQLADRLRRPAPRVPVGGMIEVPGAALTAAFFARRLDFLSIGTNDLVQYTLAIDRADHAVAALYDPFHPAVLQLVAQTIRAGERAGKPVTVCGEMAGDLEATRLLIGMGLRAFSMHPASLLRVKREILRCDADKLRARVGRLLALDDPVKMAAGLERLRDG